MLDTRYLIPDVSRHCDPATAGEAISRKIIFVRRYQKQVDAWMDDCMGYFLSLTTDHGPETKDHRLMTIEYCEFLKK